MVVSAIKKLAQGRPNYAAHEVSSRIEAIQYPAPVMVAYIGQIDRIIRCTNEIVMYIAAAMEE